MTVHMRLDTPIGELTLIARDGALAGVRFPPPGPPPAGSVEGSVPVLERAARQLREYFDGERTSFDLPLALDGTAFQQAAWRALADIPYGETVSYGEQAARLGRPDAVRAIGAANGANPVPIVLPCHRVIGADGSLTGFGGGLQTKRRLLDLERSPSLFEPVDERVHDLRRVVARGWGRRSSPAPPPGARR